MALMVLAVPSVAAPDLEAFLQGYHAARNLNYQDAEASIDAALTADPTSVEVRRAALYTWLAAGRSDTAFTMARALHAAGETSPVLSVILLADDFLNNGSEKILAGTLEIDTLPLVLARLSRAWSLLRNGQIEEGLTGFAHDDDPDDIAIIMAFHRTLANALTGNTGTALEVADAANGWPDLIAPDVRYVKAQLLASLGQHDQALEVVEEHPFSEEDGRSIRLATLHDRLSEGTAVSFDYIDSAQAGLAEGFAILGRILRETQNDAEALPYLQLARTLDPGNDLVTLELAAILLATDNPLLARRSLAAGPREAMFANKFMLINARALFEAGETDTAIQMLQEASEAETHSAALPYALGELYRLDARYRQAIDAYDTALDRLAANAVISPNWLINFHRAVTYMELDEWVAAEADLRTALSIAGRLPFLLNYLGYTLADQNIKLDEAEDLIRDAVAAEPTNGMYVDSLGWVLYRQGRYEEALDQLERAARLMSPDPVVIDHLGDAYWKNGQRDSASQQWEIALDLAKEREVEDEELIERIRRKLAIGLDKVLEEDAAAPDDP